MSRRYSRRHPGLSTPRCIRMSMNLVTNNERKAHMLVHVRATVQQTMKRYGRRDEALARASKTAGANRLIKILGEQRKEKESTSSQQSQPGSGKVPRRKKSISEAPKPWSEDLNTNAGVIFEQDVDFDNLADTIRQVDLAAQYIQNLPSESARELKKDVEDKDSATTEQYRLRFGATLTEGQMRALAADLCKNAITYYSTQVSVVVWSETEFPGSRYNDAYGIYAVGYTSKARVARNWQDSTIITTLVNLIRTGVTAQNYVGAATASFVLQKSNTGQVRYVTRMPDKESSIILKGTRLRETKKWEDIMGNDAG